ncbi:pirin family protein [Psychrosphaera sp. F3M07]|uniref:pirin family protein n=1 Tax=Psychrosphaera sp. F3M07 TaxID=2841560 RepID=UPI001C09E2A9|nr:pirin family protein [Psychrosphaera sp. F3M07]MBU2918763.1 pirin family protein [Psychrosphaera sp. F3M07]
MNKQIIHILKGMPATDGAGVKLTRAIGQPKLPNLDPFLMIDEIRSDDPNDYIAGFPPHPHRGFETLTYLMHGSMEHNDSTGGHGLINSGGVQYMTAGKGIIHSETPKQDQGLLWGFQLWINLPAKHKMVDASYVDITKEQIPVLPLKQDKTRLKLIAGQVSNFDKTGPVVRDDIQLQIYDISSEVEHQQLLMFNHNARGYIYVYQGQIQVNQQQITSSHVVTFGEGCTVDLTLFPDSGALVVMGDPIGEPIVQYGPFVMNTNEEIQQAFVDLDAGRLG